MVSGKEGEVYRDISSTSGRFSKKGVKSCLVGFGALTGFLLFIVHRKVGFVKG